MINYNPARLRQAVQFLVDSPYTHHHVVRIRSAAQRPRTTPFKGDAEVLNELVAVGRQSPQALENLIILAQEKHPSRSDYQRLYMAAKRKRDRKVLALEELMVGARLDATTRTRVLKHQYEVWNRERDALMQSLVGAEWAEKNARIRQFWERREAELDALIQEAKRNGPVRRKRVVHVRPEPRTDFGKKLASTLTSANHRPNMS